MVSKKSASKESSDSNNNSNNHPPQKNKHHQHVQYSEPEITKTDYAVAKYLRNTLPDKEAMFLGLKRVNYFIGSKAVDQLMESKWAKGDEALFKSRDDARNFLNELLVKKFYHRAKKIVKMDGEKKKFKLDMHDEQVFVDASQPYVWLYEPTSLTAWLLCLGVVFGVIAICLFPLWPPIIRTWVYYLCIAGLIFLTSILGLIVVRHILFIAIRILTLNKLHFWIFPNLTEDVGFFESFWPLYEIDASCGANYCQGDAGGGGIPAASDGHLKSE